LRSKRIPRIHQLNISRYLALLALVIAGEAIFLLPFVLSRIFRPVFLDVFGISNLQLGTAFSLYGMVAMVSYFAGGPLADRFQARGLLVSALLLTSLAGLLLAGIPSLPVLTMLYALWGLSTIFLFWAALIKTTRELGTDSQGQAFGLLDGGRGLFAALLSSFSVLIFASLLPEQVETADLQERAAALSTIILIFSGMGVFSAILVWLFIPVSTELAQPTAPAVSLSGVKRVITMPAVWMQALIILCAYVAYKSTDDFSLYARDAFGYNDVEAVRLGTLSFWMRPIAAVCAGLLADKFNGRLILQCSFALVMLGSAMIASGFLQPGMGWMLLITIAGTSAAIYALRGVYFAVMAEAKIPLSVTGSAVGLVSFIGFTPDIFMGPLMGYLIDSSPGALGHQHVFMVIFSFSLIGFTSACFFQRNSETRKKILR